MYILHHAPDNASLIVRLVLEELGAPYRTVLVDRARREQDSAAYRALNPAGLIPVLETADGPIFETGAILLWLADRHGAMAPAPSHAQRGAFLKWLFFTSNTLHTDLRQLFYPMKYAGRDPALREIHHEITVARLIRDLGLIDRLGAGGPPGWLTAAAPSVLGYYLASLLRWCALYPAGGTAWFELGDYPFLCALAETLETRPAAIRAAAAEGLGPTPFSAPVHARPREGTAV